MTSYITSPTRTPNQASPPSAEFGWSEILRVWRRWSIPILLVAVLGGGGAYILAGRMEPTYNAEAVLLYDRPDPGRVDNPADRPQLDAVQRASLVHSQITILRSNELARRVIEQLDLARTPMFQAEPGLLERARALIAPLLVRLSLASPDPVGPPLQSSEVEDPQAPAPGSDRLVRAYLDRLTVQQETDTYVLRVGFRAPDGELAARIANAHAQAYLRELREQRAKALEATSSWLQDAVASALSRVVAAEGAIERFRNGSSLVDVNGRTALDQSLAQMTSDLAQAQANAVNRQSRATEVLRLENAGQVAGIVALSGSSTLNDLQQKYNEAAAEVATLQKELGERHPSFQAAERRRAELAAAIRTETRSLVDGDVRQAEIARATVASLSAALDRLKQEVLAAGGQRAELTRLEAEAAAERNVYLTLVQKQRSFDKVGELVKGEATLLSSALVPDLPSAPRRGLFAAFGFCLAGGLAAGGLSWREGRRDVVRHTGDAMSFGGARCLAVMPAFGRSWNGAFDRTGPKFSFFFEQLRSLCAVLNRDYARPGTDSVSLLVTSSLPGEGKSTFCHELGRFAARNGIRALIVDTDPKVAPRRDGSLSDRVVRLEHDCELYGTTLASATRSLWHFDGRAVIEAWQREFDLVIVDTPPLSATADSIVLAPVVDATIVVARVDLTPRSLLTNVGQTLENAGGKLAGLVLSFAHLDSQRGVLPSDLGYYFSQNRAYHKRLASTRQSNQREQFPD